ncbi:hypothetical protein GXW82_10665 [Streptacidiphilus sp. 4-A2]|nr:hypothetical protein [Streptacidiphilus sp. 4-A2]
MRPDLPQLASCRIQRPLDTSNDTRAGRLSADLPGTTAATPDGRATGTAVRPAATAPMLLAADASAGGGGGDFTATSLKASGSWQAGGSSDSFTWSYPLSAPSVPGGLSPTCHWATTRSRSTG